MHSKTMCYTYIVRKSSLDTKSNCLLEAVNKTGNVPFHLLAQVVPVGLVVQRDPMTRKYDYDPTSFQNSKL